MKDKDKKNYGDLYQEMLEKQGYLFVNDPPAEGLADKYYTYEDYLNWPEDERIELIDGKIYYMAAPNQQHQELSRRLSSRFDNYLHGKKCDSFSAPFDVRIDFMIGNESVVQPDLLVVCDKNKLDGRGLNGAPDFIIEILSPSNRSHDLVRKYNKYLEVGVQEYWIVDPLKEAVAVNLLTDDKKQYLTTTFKKGDEIKVDVLDELTINVTDLFDGYRGKEIVEVETAKLKIARKMLESGLTVVQISEIIDLSVAEITKIM